MVNLGTNSKFCVNFIRSKVRNCDFQFMPVIKLLSLQKHTEICPANTFRRFISSTYCVLVPFSANILSAGQKLTYTNNVCSTIVFTEIHRNNVRDQLFNLACIYFELSCSKSQFIHNSYSRKIIYRKFLNICIAAKR